MANIGTSSVRRLRAEGRGLRPEVSVCVPAFNASRTIGGTLESILEQDFDDFEVVIVNNNSVDDTLEIVKSYHDSRIHIFSNDSTLPIAESWNRAVSFAQADLVKLVCADDLIARNCLSMQFGTMRDPRIALVASIFDIIDDDGILLASAVGLPGLQGLHSSEELSRVLVRRVPDEIAPTAAFMFRREQFARTCGFRSDFLYALDIDLFARLCMNGDFFGHSESLAINRASTFNYSSRTSSISKFVDILNFNHAMMSEFPEKVGIFDVAIGDLRVARAGIRRLRVRADSFMKGLSEDGKSHSRRRRQVTHEANPKRLCG